MNPPNFIYLSVLININKPLFLSHNSWNLFPLSPSLDARYKSSNFITFPLDNMDMKDYVCGPDKNHSIYDCFAVSQHYGSLGGGHYTAICKNIDNKWYSYNDSSCSETSKKQAISDAAYVIFYRRKTD